MKQKLILLLSSILFVGLFANNSFGQDDPTVYVTRTGAKYHRVTCSYLRKSSIPMKLSEAASYYGPCSRCHPPVLNNQSDTESPDAVITKQTSPTKKSNKTQTNQCLGTTKKGARCKRTTSNPSGYCYQHINQSTITPTKSAIKDKKDTTITKTSTKSSDRIIYTGPRGGQYYYNDKGKKVYIKKD
jgi:hypothetical protein